ncbi:hypothetical protein AMA2_9 [Achromobacter phage AMA2]|nr:hypothetical protein AMA2_9 [Achromobacter phage AMA2]
MGSGFRTYNTAGVEQLNSLMPGLRIIAYGTAAASPYGDAVAIPDVWPESPMLLIRMSPGVSVGAVNVFQRHPFDIPNCFRYQSNGPFEWAVASTRGTPIAVGAGNVGLKLWDEAGNLTFSSAYKYPRIQAIASVPAPPFNNSPPMTSAVAIPQIGAWPWLICNELIYVYEAPDGMGGSYPGAAFSAVLNGNASVLTIEMRSSDQWSTTGFGLSPSYNPYISRPLRIPLCIVPGL